MHRIPKPIIAAVNGWALAGGLETALACDIRIASERAMFGSFEARRGFHHGDGGIVRLVNIVRRRRRHADAPHGRAIDAQRALQCNMVSKVVPHDDLMEEASPHGNTDPAQLAGGDSLRQDDDPRRDRPAARPPASPRGLERRTRAPTPMRRRRCYSGFYERTDAGRAGTHETALD
jgi:hypothetical protein